MPPKKSAENQALGRAIRAARRERGFAQEAFAARAGVDRSYYGAIERGEFNVSLDTIAKIAAGLMLSMSELFKRAELQTLDCPSLRALERGGQPTERIPRERIQ
jgi:transcriptional regulator with XRE-family HTH domain